jgi:hypothetical protein
MVNLAKHSTSRRCYRCGNKETGDRALQLLPGSQYIVLCGECLRIVWGWQLPSSDAAPGAVPTRPGGKSPS